MNNIKFKIIIPSYNNENWVEANLASILNQSYDNYEVLYINDASTDNTLNRVVDLVLELPNWHIVTNETNRRRGYNISPYNDNIQKFVENDDDVLVFVDGDDWLFDDDVLTKLANIYQINDFWMTYGGMVCYPGGEIGYPQNTPYDEYICNNNLFRKDAWRASHLRTFKWGLYRRIRLDSMLYSKTNEYYFHAEDLATSYPCLEMCPQEKIGILDFYSYIFNATPNNRARGVAREIEAGIELETEIRNQVPYKKIKNIYD